MAEAKNGCPTLMKKEELGKHPIEVVGKQIRSMFEKRDRKILTYEDRFVIARIQMRV